MLDKADTVRLTKAELDALLRAAGRGEDEWEIGEEPEARLIPLVTSARGKIVAWYKATR